MTDTYSVSLDTAPIPLVPQTLVRAECVRFMWAQALRSIAMLPPVVALMLWIESPYIPTTRLVAWASIMAAAVGMSLAAALAYRMAGPSSDSPRNRCWLCLRSLTGAIQGTGWGLSAVLIMPSHLHRDMRVVLMTFLVGITTSMVIAYAGSVVAYLPGRARAGIWRRPADASRGCRPLLRQRRGTQPRRHLGACREWPWSGCLKGSLRLP